MLSPLAVLLLTLCAISAAAVEPNATARAPTPAESSASRLESIVEEMATGQQMQQQGAAPMPAITDEVVILDGQERRELAPRPGSCACTEYRNGAKTDKPYCAKPESDKIICMPQQLSGHSRCNAEAVPCGGEDAFSMATPRASPGASWKFNDAEREDYPHYLNVQFELTPMGNAGLPPADEYPFALAHLAGVKVKDVNAVVASSMARKAGTPPSITLHATIGVDAYHKREPIRSLMAVTEKIVVKGTSFRVVRVDFYERSGVPMVCGSEQEDVKKESAALLRQLVALREQEVNILRQAALHASSTCSGPEMHNIAQAFQLNAPQQ